MILKNKKYLKYLINDSCYLKKFKLSKNYHMGNLER